MTADDILVHARPVLPRDVAVLCIACGGAVPLALFVDEGGPKRQVGCPGCARDVVLRDAW